ncbi:MAG: hypothetical protein Q7J54_02650 [Candidatus Woesearchaeota archaeon]|nr:hypothetical protein [Candidatus Woesearchaeota archaeon]
MASKLLKISFIGAIVGIILLFIISENISIAKIPIDMIDESYIGRSVRFSGEITKISSWDKFSSIEVNGRILVVLFDKVNLTKGNKIEVIGKVDEYKNKIEVVADSIRIIN